jgi:hypothetical protein
MQWNEKIMLNCQTQFIAENFFLHYFMFFDCLQMQLIEWMNKINVDCTVINMLFEMCLWGMRFLMHAALIYRNLLQTSNFDNEIDRVGLNLWCSIFLPDCFLPSAVLPRGQAPQFRQECDFVKPFPSPWLQICNSFLSVPGRTRHRTARWCV